MRVPESSIVSQTATCCLEINLFVKRLIIYIYIFWRLNIFWKFFENELRFFRCLITRSPGTLVNNIFRPRPIPVKLFSTKFINYLSQTRHHSVFTWFSRFFLKTRQRINTEKLADAEFFDKNGKKLHFCGWEIGKEYSNLKHPKLLRFKQSWHPIAGKFRPQFSMNRYNSKFNIPNIILSSRISKNWYSGPNFIKKTLSEKRML